MAIDPDIIPPSSDDGKNAISQLPKWVTFTAIGLIILLLIGILRTLLPLIVLGLLVFFILRQASKG